VRIDRIFTINSELNLYSIVYAIAEKFPTLTSMPLSALDGTNFKMLIAIQHVTPVHRVRQSLRMEMPTPEMVEVSDLALGRPATVVNFIAYSPSGEAVYYQDFYIPPTRYRLNLGTTTNPGG
jgi:DNA-binding GntR family transcriptional regulator